MSEPIRINQKQLVKIFKDIKRLNSEEIRFCFLLGAGASQSSGIPTGWELSKRWYENLKEDLNNEELSNWENNIQFDEKNIGEFYPHLFKKRYESSPKIGFEEFKKYMDKSEPGLGYVILSQVLANEKHNFVITTNFDHLVEDAVRTYTDYRPFSVGHESLAMYISPQTERPTIIKVHRDLFHHPFNEDENTKSLKEEWRKALQPILNNFNLLVIGYGGNDGSLMDYLNKIKAIDRRPIYWCIRKNKDMSSKVSTLLTKNDYLISINNFDDLMYDLNEVLEYKILNNLDKPNDHILISNAKNRIQNLERKISALIIEKEYRADSKLKLSDSLKRILEGPNKYILRIYSTNDKRIIKQNIDEGLKKYPNNNIIKTASANFLWKDSNTKDFDKAEEIYEEIINSEEESSFGLNSYAGFLISVRKDYEKAYRCSKRAIELDPNNVLVITLYAIVLSSWKNNIPLADSYYKKAITLDPEGSFTTGNYAIFLHGFVKDEKGAEKYYQKSIAAEPDNAFFLGNYANFISDFRKDDNKADNLFKEALQINPNAEGIAGYYALFLHNIRKKPELAEKYYKQSIKQFPPSANNLANYAHFLIIIKKNFKEAEKLIDKAFELKPFQKEILVELWFYRFAHYNDYFVSGEKEVNKLIESGAKSIGWDLQSHIDIAKNNDHPNVQKLQEYSDKITKE